MDHDNQNQEPQPTPQSIDQNAFARDTATPDFAAVTPEPQMPKRKRRFSLKNLTKKQKILVIIGAVALGLLLSFAIWWFFLRATPEQPAATIEAPPPPTTEASRLTGLQVDPEINKRHVTGVMVENSPDARPQSGLVDADIVYEAVAEGGITRFLALYQDTEPKKIGPIRSARPYYLDWLLPYDAGYAHVGGSPEALQQIRSLKIKDLDQFANPGAYERVSSRFAPHNVYSSIPKLDKVEEQKGYKSSNTIGFARKSSETPLEQVKAKTISFNISSPLYNVSYNYSKKDNQYLRVMGGKKHVDEKSGKQIAAKVVVALVMEKGLMADGHHTRYGTVGSGRAFIFQDGTVIKAKWKKSARNKQFTFTTSSGDEVQLNPGKTWLTVVSSPGSVSYKP